MKTLRALVWPAVMLLSLFSFGIAFSDEGTVSAAANAGLTMWTPLIVVGLGAIAYCIRQFTPNSGWLHTGPGHALIAAITAMLGAVAGTIQTSGLSKQSIILAVAGAIGGVIGAANPSVKDGSVAPPKTGIGSTLPLLFFLPLALVLTGCPSAGSQALGKCELGQLLAQDQTVAVDVAAIASAGGTNWQSQLEGLGASLLPGQLSCVVQAIADAWSASHGELSPERAAALARLNQYLAAHPARACAGTLVILRG